MEIEKIASQQSSQLAEKSIQTPGHSAGNRQESGIGDISPVRDSNFQQIVVWIEGQSVDHRHEGETGIAQQEQRNRDVQQQQDHRHVQNTQCIPNLNKEKELTQQF